MRLAVLFPPVLMFAALASPATAAQDAGGRTQATPRPSPAEERDQGSGRLVTLELREVTLEQALLELGRQAKLEVSYTDAVTRSSRKVTVALRQVPLEHALDELLRGTGLEAIRSEDGRALIVREHRRGVRADSSAVTGTVTDSRTGEALAGAEVLLEGTRWRTGTAEDGRYRLAQVAPGNYKLTVRRIGYAKQSRPVSVVSERETTVDVALQPVPTQLDEIVTTVTGEQRLRELGHVVGRINADSLVREAPVSSLSELLNGRVPGLQVFTRSGMVGGKVSLQVRTPNTILLGTEPIVILDGIRYTSGTSGSSGPFEAEQTSRLNDLNPNDIESIEVVKGPSAATLYGTDAANGVLVITTKRGRPGPARWNAYARTNLSEIPRQHYPEAWWGWGSATSSCTLADVAQGACVQDSVMVLPNPLNDPAQTIFGSKPRWEYGANVSGGQQQLRYYFSGDFERAIGPIQMPQDAIERLELQRGVTELPEEQREPNAFTKMNLRANVTASLGPTAELHLDTGYGRNATRTLSLFGGTPYEGGWRGTPINSYGSNSGESPEQMFALTSTEQVDRFYGSAAGQWRPLVWLQTRGTVGLDLASSHRYSLARPGEASLFETGIAGDERTRQLGITADLGLTAMLRHGRLGFRTAVGTQYVRSLSNALGSVGTGLPPGGESVGQAASVFVGQSYAETVTLGSYLEETLGLNDRLFVTGALRMDGASAFGRDYDAAIYPKASVSWILSEEPFVPRLPGLDELRLRYAFGASGQQALPTMALPEFIVEQATLDGAPTNLITLFSLGNATLRPERVREHEVGLDASGLEGRVRLGLTWFKRKTIDQILNRPLPLGFGTIFTNLGLVTGRGFEAELTARLVDTRLLSWQVSLQHAVRRSLLVELGDAAPAQSSRGGYVEGYPLGASFGQSVVGYADANGDGIITPDEVQLSESVYLGESAPPRTQTLTTVVGLFQQRLRLSALFERRTGFTQVNQLKYAQCSTGRCRAAVDPTTPLAEQAEVAAGIEPIEPGNFTRFREVTATLDLPSGLLRAVRLRSGSLSVAARNLALWTSLSGSDPESASVSGISGGAADGIPQGRSWVVRLDLGL